MQLYQYHELQPPPALQAAFERVTTALRAGDFRAADVKKMAGTPYYRARLNDADRLLFRFARYDGQTCLLLLELILNHTYERSKFLRGVAADAPAEAPLLLQPADVPAADVETLAFVPPTDAPGRRTFHLLDRPLFFDADQRAALDVPTPLVLIGAAGSGKTALVLEKFKTLTGDADAPACGLYVTRSAYLADNAARLYAAHRPPDGGPEISFLSLAELIGSIQLPAGEEATARHFAAWFALHRPHVPLKDGDRLFEEFHGVLTGADPTQPYRSPAEYEALGARQSVFAPAERPAVYALFRKYLDWLRAENRYNPNIVAHERLALARPTYDFVVVDEVQDLTNTQLALILRTLRRPGQFILCGDAHQVVHPNFFSWSGLKALFFQGLLPDGGSGTPAEPLHLLRANYRNAAPVTALANRLLQLKNRRFGSLDRVSTFLVEAANPQPGEVVFLRESADAQRQLNDRIRRSTHFAVVVLREEDKAAVRQFFDTPLLFSVHEAKGLEYDNIVLVNCISHYERLFREVAADLTPADVAPDADLRYARPADRADHHAEHYKFFVNALYVAVTRARQRLFVVERQDQHPLLPLLGLTQPRARVELAAQTSTADEWRQEARRLEKQGRTEQAQAIREQVLEQQQPHWPILTRTELNVWHAAATDPTHYNRKAKDRFFEYALLYDDANALLALANLTGSQQYKPVFQNLHAAHRHFLNKRYGAYMRDTPSAIAAHIERYGPDVRDEFGLTPLLIAASVNAWKLIAWLCERQAAPSLPDIWGRLPWHVVLTRLAQHPAEMAPRIGDLYRLLAPPVLHLRMYRYYHKLRADQPAYLLFCYLLFGQKSLLQRKFRQHRPPALLDTLLVEATDVLALFQAFPDSIVPPHYKTHRYCSTLLADHEVWRESDRSRRLWVRIRRGHYLINPFAEFEYEPGEWMPVQVIQHMALVSDPKVTNHDLVDAVISYHYGQCHEELTRQVQRREAAAKSKISAENTSETPLADESAPAATDSE